MTAVDIWAAVMAAIGGATISLRSYMLRPCQRGFAAAPAPVWCCLTVLGIVLDMCAVSVRFLGHASGREAVLLTVLAICGVVMLVNVHLNGRVAPEAGH